MLDMFLRILSVLGIILLSLAVFLLTVLLLALFFPVAYRIRCRKDNEALRQNEDSRHIELSAGMNWLFGLLRVRYSYPEPGILTVKLLCFKLYQAKLPQAEKKDEEEFGGETERREAVPEPEQTSCETADEPEQGASVQEEIQPEETIGQDRTRTEEEPVRDETQSEDMRDRFLKKFQKIKYTIRSIYDKIKEIWKNISYYTALLQEENTRELCADVRKCIVRVLKDIRPRRIRANILFGTGSPDKTGYVFGMYCMFYPVLGDGFIVTPDFDRAVLEGSCDISGHITVFVLGINIVRLMLNKKLRLFIKKLKKQDAGRDGGSEKKAVNGKAPGKKAGKPA